MALDVVIENHKLTLISLYGPNTDSPDFYEQISTIIDDFGNSSYIICGDFNLVLNPEIDCFNYVNINNPKARKTVLQLIENKNMVDCFREHNPDIKRFTWRKKKPLKQARLDFFLISDNLLPSLNKSNIESSYRSDHSITTLQLTFNDFQRGRGLWKFNNSLLNDIEFLDTIKNKILDVKKQYAVPVYNKDRISDINDNEITFTIDDQLFLETLMMELRGKCISYGSYKKSLKIKTEQKLIEEIQILEDMLHIDNTLLDKWETKQKELQALRTEKLKGNLLRSKAKWVMEGEKPSHYFCNLESRNFTNKIIPNVQKENGDIISDQKEILKEATFFYQELYSYKDSETGINRDLNTELNNYKVPKLSVMDSEGLEGLITYTEASNTLKNMKNDKSPGSSGFTTEFF